ncbi:hypothetical protein RhiirA5_423586 [Rhizophagus irregularis]|uniref:Uncharacterized protein n=2 Tax=Rhizophagus irregularis TaxID=588596 RepID=A0A2N0P9P7_9GLOM|nr:hypothetical protein RhiirA5_423586 [Rhizophagus irregularis]
MAYLCNEALEIHNRLKITRFTNEIKNIDRCFRPNALYGSIYQGFNSIHSSRTEILMEWIPYSQFTNV